jgi:hypothetical protein
MRDLYFGDGDAIGVNTLNSQARRPRRDASRGWHNRLEAKMTVPPSGGPWHAATHRALDQIKKASGFAAPAQNAQGAFQQVQDRADGLVVRFRLNRTQANDIGHERLVR